jgi:Type II secretion system (T2SS), protein E, N-terminal domain
MNVRRIREEAGRIVKSQILAGRKLLRQMASHCASCGQTYYRLPWRGLDPRWQGARMAGGWYCRAECLQLTITELLQYERSVWRPETATPHRVPLGLLLLSRQQLTEEQLRVAIETQRSSGGGRIGECLVRLGFVNEPQVTAALARQWSCPVLRTRLGDSSPECAAEIPLPLLEAFQMIPVEFSELTGTLLMAFSDAVDYRALYAIEQMLGVRTEPCFVGAGALRNALAERAGRGKVNDVVFRETEDAGASARIVAGYAEKVLAREVRLARCGGYLWARLEKPAQATINLVLEAGGRTRIGSASSSSLATTA